jgi:hypothetical protein
MRQMGDGLPGIPLDAPAAAVPGAALCSVAGRNRVAGTAWAPLRRLQSGRGQPRSGVPLVDARGRMLHRRTAHRARLGGGPPMGWSANAVAAVQRSDGAGRPAA